MDLMPLMEWLQNMQFATYVRESALFYPVVLSLHLIGLGLFGSLVAMTDFRLLGWAMKDRPFLDVHAQLRPYKHLGLTLIVTCGLTLGWSKAAIYWPNPFFKTKLTMLLLAGIHALVFRASVYKNPDGDKVPQGKIAAVISLCIWTTMILCGRMIGYWEPAEF